MADREALIATMREAGCPESKIEHCQDVALVARDLALGLRAAGRPVDLEVVETGAMLHDIGIAFTGDDLSPEHCALGADYLRQHGFPESVARCVERHEMGGLLRDEAAVFSFPEPLRETYMPETWDEKVVAFADLMYFTIVEDHRDPWANPRAAADALHAYADACYRKRRSEPVPENYAVFVRATQLTQELLPYLSRETFARWDRGTGQSGAENLVARGAAHQEGGQ